MPDVGWTDQNRMDHRRNPISIPPSLQIITSRLTVHGTDYNLAVASPASKSTKVGSPKNHLSLAMEYDNGF